MSLSDEGQTDLEGMVMGVLRWLLRSHRSKDEAEDEQERAEEWKRGKRARGHHPPNAYRIEVDGESRAMRGEGPPFSFWSSARIILILSFLLWWIQPAGPMIAGYVGGAVDSLIMRVADVFMAYPFMLLTISIIAVHAALAHRQAGILNPCDLKLPGIQALVS